MSSSWDGARTHREGGGWGGTVSGGVNQQLRLKESAVCGARCARKEDGADPAWKRESLNGTIQEEGRRKRSWWWSWDTKGVAL